MDRIEPKELRATYFTLFSMGVRHGAAGILRDVLADVARRETTAGRCLLVAMLGPFADVDALIDQFRNGPGLDVEALLPMLTAPGLDGRR